MVENAIVMGSLNYEAALAAIETLGVMLQVTSEAGIVVNSKMRATAGMRVINGALQQDDRSRNKPKASSEASGPSPEEEALSLQYEQVRQVCF